MARQIQYAGEFDLDTLKLYSSTGVFADISDIVLSIDLNENIFNKEKIFKTLISEINYFNK